MLHYVYILTNQQHSQYVGHTDDLEARLREHNSGTVIATKSGRPWDIAWFCAYKNISDAISFERHLKTGSGTAFRYKHFVSKKK